MPCRDERDYGVETSTAIRKMKARLDEVTQNLCYLCGTAEMNALHILKGNKRLAEWWKDHQKSDTERVSEAMNRFIISGMANDANEVAEHFIATAEAEHPVSEFHKDWFYDLAVELVAKYFDAKTAKANLADSIKGKLSPDEIVYLKTNSI